MSLHNKWKERAAVLDEPKLAEDGNLFYRYLANFTNDGDPVEYDKIARLLIERMKKWNDDEDGKTRHQWSFQRTPVTGEGIDEPYGHDLLFLANLLLSASN